MAKQLIRKTAETRKTKSSPAKKNSANRTELNKLLKKLDEKEILWVLTQVKTIVHNQKVAEINAAALDLQKKRSPKKPGNKAASPKTSTVDVVQLGNGKNFNILWDNARLFVNLTELKSLVKIAEAVTDHADGAGRIYRWFQRERNDIIIDGNISGPADPHLKKLVRILNDKFSTGSK